MKPVVTLVGRPNVGKSTLFNRLTRSRDALVADEPGLTRDRHYGEGRVGDKPYLVVDTGGFEPDQKTGMKAAMAKQTIEALNESDVVLFLVDARSGLMPDDQTVAEFLRRRKTPYYLVVNKAEGRDRASIQAEFYELGLGTPRVISASHGEGVKELIDETLAPFPETAPEPISSKPCFAVIGRPNVGKSTLVNALLGADRVIAFDEAGTTRDSIYVDFKHQGEEFTIIDTAGVRKSGKVTESIEKFSVIKALKAIEDANVVLLVVDATQEIADQDATLGGFTADKGRACVIIVNKWDAASKEQKEAIKKSLARKLYFLDYAEIHYVSALKDTRWDKIFASVLSAYHSAFKKLPTPQVIRVLQAALEKQAPPSGKGRFRAKMRYAHQGGSNPPMIVIHGNVAHIPASYTRYLSRNFIEAFDLQGTPLKIKYLATVNPFVTPKEGLSKTKELRRAKLSNRIAKRETQKQLKKSRAKSKSFSTKR